MSEQVSSPLERVQPRNWTIDATQAPDVYELTFYVGRQPWRHGYQTEPFKMAAMASITGSLKQFEQLARDLLADVAAIRAEKAEG